MTKNNLKSGMIVKTIKNNYYLVFLNAGTEDNPTAGINVLLGIDVANGNIKDNGWMNLMDYNDDLTIADNFFNICEVYSTRFSANIGDFKKYTKVWSRE